MRVSELNLAAKALLEAHLGWVELVGELSKITKHSSGHWYFELKDERASISCVMFRGANLRVGFNPAVGDELELFGSVSLYEQGGRYQFNATKMRRWGQGNLEAAFLALKNKLEREGLFDPAHKRPLPNLPKKIGLITSQSSAALQDLLKIIRAKGNFLPKIYIFDALTQGQAAPASLISALSQAETFKLDAIILARGGGSREDLFCFNDEGLARAIFAAKTPIISAIGHEIDYVLSDFVADARAATPSQAVDLLFTSRAALEQDLDFLQNKLEKIMENTIYSCAQELFNLEKFFKASSLKNVLENKVLSCENSLKNLNFVMKNIFERANFECEKIARSLHQHEAFFAKSEHFVELKKEGKLIKLEEAKSGDELILSSLKTQKSALIL